MKVRWHGYGVRLIADPHHPSDGGFLEWSERTGYVQDVAERELLANLLTYPGERFTVDAGDEIMQLSGMTEDAAAALALAGAPDLAELARLATDEELRAAVVAAAAMDATQVLDWAEQARKLMEV